MKRGKIRVLRDAGFARRLQTELATPPEPLDDWLASHGRVLKVDANSTVALIPLDGEEHYIKLYRPKATWQRWGFRFGLGRGTAAFDAAQRLQRADIDVPTPEACVAVSGCVLLLTEALRGVDLKALWLTEPDAAEGASLMEAAGNALGSLHRAEFAHGDCKWSNLIHCDGRLFFADLEAVKKSPPGGAGASRDLARFTLNAEDLGLPIELYRVFLDRYLAESGQPAAPTRAAVLPLLEALRARHLARYGERGHRLLDAEE